MNDLNTNRLWYSCKELAERYGVERVTIWRWAKSGRIPKPKQLSPGTTRWNAAEIEQHESKIGGAA